MTHEPVKTVYLETLIAEAVLNKMLEDLEIQIIPISYSAGWRG